MKKATVLVAIIGLAVLMASFGKASSAQSGPLKVAVVSLKECLDSSKWGKHEQAQYDTLRKGLEEGLEKKQKELDELSPKFAEEYISTLSKDAQEELKEKFRTLSQSLSQDKAQYYQVLRESDYQAVRAIEDAVVDISKKLADEKKIDLVLQDGVLYAYHPTLDLSKDVVRLLDKKFDDDMAKRKADEKK